MTRGALRIASVLALTGCDDTRGFEPIVLDSSPNCARVRVEPLVFDLNDGPAWTRVLAAAHETPRTDAYWLLVEVDDPVRGTRHAVAHIDTDGGIEGAFVDGLSDERTLELKVGSRPDEAWLVDSAPGWLQLWRFQNGPDGVIATRSPSFGGFPFTDRRCRDPGGQPIRCDVSTWPRQLAFLSGEPFIVSVPPISPDRTTDLWLGRIDETTLGLTEERELEFAPVCHTLLPPEQYEACLQGAAIWEVRDIHVIAEQRTSQPGTWSTAIMRTNALLGTDVIFQDVVIVSVGTDDDGAPVGALRGHHTATPLDPSEKPQTLGADDYAFYWLADFPEQTFVGRYSLLTFELSYFSPFVLGQPRDILQLEDDVAVGWIAEGEWNILKIFPAAPELSEHTSYTAPTPIVAARHAGDGVFMLERTSGGPDLVRVRCDEP